MSGDARADELLGVYAEFRRALESKDFKAFLRLAWFQEDLGKKEVKKDFKENRETYLLGTPDLTGAPVLWVKDLPGGLLAMACVGQFPWTPGKKHVGVRLFEGEPGSFRVSPRMGAAPEFEPVAGEDPAVTAQRAFDALEEGAWIPPYVDLPGDALHAGAEEGVEEAVSPAEATPPAHWDRVLGPFDQELVAGLHCFAYDCELEITINGVRVGYGGGSSYNMNLYGYKWGEQPKGSNLLTVGKNRIEVRNRRTGPPDTGLKVEIRLDNGAVVLDLVSHREPEASFEVEFVIPASPTKEIPPDTIEPVVVRDS